MKPVRVLQVFYCMDCGGAETLMMNVYRFLDRRKVQLDFVVHTDHEGFYDREIQSLGGRIYHAPDYKVYNHISYMAWWQAFFKSHPEYRLLHGHMLATAAIYMPLAKKNGVLTIAHSHLQNSEKSLREALISLYEKPVAGIADYRFACSREAALWMFGSRHPYTLFKNGIDARAYLYDEQTRKAVRKELNILPGTFVIGNVSRFHPQKNHLFLLEVFALYHKKNPKSLLLLAGDGPQRPLIEKKIKELHLEDSACLLGVRRDIPQLLEAMDFFLFPSLGEGLGIALVEAQASGLPCLVGKEAIPRQAILTDLVDTLPLSSDASHWAKRIPLEAGRRTSPSEQIEQSGFDIRQNAHWLQDFYLNSSKP